MKKPQIKRVAIAGIPLILLIGLTLLFGYITRIYVQCERGNCEPIGQNLNRVLVADEPVIRELVPGEPLESIKKKEIMTAERTAAIYSGRLTFIFLAMAYFLICALAAAIGCFVIARSLAQTTKHSTRWLLGAIGLTVAFGLSLYFRPDSILLIFDPLFRQTISHDLTTARDFMVKLNSFGFAVILFLTLAIGAILYPGKAGAKPDDLKQLSRRMRNLQLILYVGTLMLIVGVLLIRSVYHWSLAFILREGPALKAADTFFSGLLTAEGGYFTLILAAVYLPAAFILRTRAELLTGLPEAEPEKEKVLQNYNLAFSLSQSLPRLAAILGPVLVGPIGEMFSRLQ